MLALQYLLLALPYLMAVGLGLALIFLFIACWRHFAAGFVVIAGTFLLEALYMSLGGLELGISIYYSDLSMMFITGVVLLRLATDHDAPPIPWAWRVFVLVFAVNLAAGLATHGTAAGVQARPSFYAIAAATYPMTFRFDERKLTLFIHALLGMAPILLVLCVYRWIVYYTPLPELLPEEGSYNVDGAIRVIGSHQTLVIAQALLICLFFTGTRRGIQWSRAMVPLLVAGVIVLQHRSVWVATLAGVLGALFVTRAGGASRLQQLLLLGLATVAVALPMAMSSQLSDVSEQVTSSATSAASGEGTVSERLESWQEIVKKWVADGPRSILIGQSIGSDASRFVHDGRGNLRKIAYAAHNHYVQLLSGMGLIGLGSFVVLIGRTMTALWLARQHGPRGQACELMLALMTMQLVYYIPYSTDYFQHLVLGLAVALAGIGVTSRQALSPVAKQATTPPRWASRPEDPNGLKAVATGPQAKY